MHTVAGIPLTEDLKNLIRDDELSRHLLKADALPSFAECVEGSSTELLREKDKDIPRIPGWTYNHFLQASAFISFACTGDGRRYVLGYCRVALPEIPEHTPGLAILWGASFLYKVREYYPRPMDRWMEEVAYVPVRAKDSFTAERGSVLADLLARKINLKDLPLTSAGFGVVTNDQRDSGAGVRRVYTQYVFDVRLPPYKSTDECLEFIRDRALGIHVCPLLQSSVTAPKQEEQFANPHTGKRNLLDILVWRGMFSNEQRLALEKATLTKGLELLPRRPKGSAGG